MLSWIRSLPHQMAQRWRQSIRFRVILSTIVGSTLVLILLLPALLGNITAGVLGSKEASALAEAAAARGEAQRILDATPAPTGEVPASRTIEAVVAAMAARGAQAGLFEVLILASEPAGLSLTPERGTNLVSETSVPAQMREIVAGSQRQALRPRGGDLGGALNGAAPSSWETSVRQMMPIVLP